METRIFALFWVSGWCHKLLIKHRSCSKSSITIHFPPDDEDPARKSRRKFQDHHYHLLLPSLLQWNGNEKHSALRTKVCILYGSIIESGARNAIKSFVQCHALDYIYVFGKYLLSTRVNRKSIYAYCWKFPNPASVVQPDRFICERIYCLIDIIIRNTKCARNFHADVAAIFAYLASLDTTRFYCAILAFLILSIIPGRINRNHLLYPLPRGRLQNTI